ncbi:MAG: hypothetical protein ACRDTE_23825 [Pseudonocardiaceae bacterium]
MEIVRALVGGMRHELAEHRRSLAAVAGAIMVLVLAGTVAALAGSAIAVAAIAGTGIIGTALAVLAFTAFMRI